jgi:transaldolase/glucose-6-phosphate isomerase
MAQRAEGLHGNEANPVAALHAAGQAVWLDFLSRSFLAERGLEKLVARDHLTGVTSNPSIFEKAIGGSADYDGALKAAEAAGDLDVMALYERVAIEDIRQAADTLRPVYDATNGADGYVSLEVSPYLAHDTEATIAEARRLWAAVHRDNLMVKVPATPAGLPAIGRLTAEGVNVNITLLFSQAVYEQVVDAYLGGLEDLIARGGDPARIASVASFFVSRIDVAVDRLIEERLPKTTPEDRETLVNLRGKVAIANAKLAFQRYKRRFSGARWEALQARGARAQRLLWASTGTKNPAYSDVLYVEELIAPGTVNTMPPSTLDAFRDHGTVRLTLEEDLAAAENVMATLARCGISIDDVTAQLVQEGVRLFADSFDKLLSAVASKRTAMLGDKLDRQSLTLPAALDKAVADCLDAWRRDGTVRRLWAGDAGIWTSADESKWLGWLRIADAQVERLPVLDSLAAEVQQAGWDHALLLGMGGSSLGPEVLAKTFAPKGGAPLLRVLDSTDPAQIRAFESGLDPARTLYIVSSKSGTTLEPNILEQYFFDRAARVVGPDKAGAHFIAVTDPGSKLEALAREKRFRRIAHGKPDIGGRYSVLSDFGLVPAAIMGLDVSALLTATRRMVHACGASTPPAHNPGAVLGTALGLAARTGRDKLTIVASPGIADFGAWLEQLVAESTGKNGKGIIPVDAEPLGAPQVYGQDRVFAYLRLSAAPDPTQDAAVDVLQKAGQPVIRIDVTDATHIGQEFFRWEMATAVAGAILGVNPFDQPDVEASKVKTRELTAAYEKSGQLPAETPFLEEGALSLYADACNREALQTAGASLASVLGAHLGSLREGDYFALLAYLPHNAAHTEALQRVRAMVRDRARVATCLGFGPRFLHSTGQAYKGGPNTGVFLQVTCDDPDDLAVPQHAYTFGTVKAAQARGDFDVLAERGRRALRVHLGSDVSTGLATLASAIQKALA